MKNRSDSPILLRVDVVERRVVILRSIEIFLLGSSSIETGKIAFDRKSCSQIGFIHE